MENVYNNDNMIVGLDIGTTKIATVIGYRNENGQIDIIGYGKSESTGVEFGEIRNINKTVTGITLSTSMASQRSNQEIKSVYVGIAGHHIKTSRYNHHLFRQGKKTPITSEEIENLKNEVFHATVPPGEEIIDVIPQKYLIDKERVTFEPVGELGNEVIGTYQLITGKISEIDRIKMCGEESGIHLNDIILEPIASGMACLTEEEKRHGVALVDIGGGTSDLIIFVDGNPVYTKVIAMGGKALRITSCFYLFLGLIYVTRGTLNGVGDAFFSFVNGIVEMLGRICLPIILLGYTNIGVWVIWLTAGLTWMLAGVSCVLRYRSWVVKKSGLRSKI